jgi:uncharacterized membrane protein YgcG
MKKKFTIIINNITASITNPKKVLEMISLIKNESACRISEVLNKFAYKLSIYIIITITLILFLVVFNNASSIYCMPGSEDSVHEDLVYEELNEFVLQGFKDRIQVLKETIEASDDPGMLREILLELSSKVREVAVPSIMEPFSGNEAINLPTRPASNWKEILWSLSLFFLATIVGYILLNYSFILGPILYYKYQILNLLSFIQQNPASFIDFMSEFYNTLADDGFFDAFSSGSSSGSNSGSDSSSGSNSGSDSSSGSNSGSDSSSGSGPD